MADAKLMKISWGTLTGIVLAAGASGATVVAVSGQLSSHEAAADARSDERQRRVASAHGEQVEEDPQATNTSTEAPSIEEMARALAMLQAHLGSQNAETNDSRRGPEFPEADDRQHEADTQRAPDTHAEAEESWEQGEGESAAVALARLERAYRAELARNAELERNVEFERSAAFVQAEIDRREQEEEESRYLAARASDNNETVNRYEAADNDDGSERVSDDDEQETAVASVSQYAMNSMIYAPVFVGSAAPPPVESATKTSTPAPYPVIPPGAFFGVRVPQSSSSSKGSSQNKTQVYVSFRPGQASSPWAPIDMSGHNNPWSSTPGVP